MPCQTSPGPAVGLNRAQTHCAYIRSTDGIFRSPVPCRQSVLSSVRIAACQRAPCPQVRASGSAGGTSVDSEVRAVNIAIASNILIFTAKCVVSAHSGSSSLLAEAVHSLADIGNQLLLRLGIAKSLKQPTAEFPYGYLKDKFVFSLISAVGVFCIGAGASMINGVNALADVDHDVGSFNLGFLVLAVSFVVEGFSCWVAVRTVAQGAARCGVSFSDYLDSGSDPAAVAVMAEDGAAVVGVVIAAAATLLVKLTDWQAWDGIGSILVGVLLAFVALFLIQRNRSALIGRSMSSEDFARVMDYLNTDPVVNKVYDAKSEEIGAGVYRFTAELDFNGRVIAERHLRTIDSTALFRKFQNTKNERNPLDERAFTIVLQEYGSMLVQAVGAEVDRIESEIRARVPGVRYVDLEADRGRFSLYKSSMDEGDYAGRGWFDMSQLSMDEAPWVNEIDRLLFDVGGGGGAGAGSGAAADQPAVPAAAQGSAQPQRDAVVDSSAASGTGAGTGSPVDAAELRVGSSDVQGLPDGPQPGVIVVQRQLNQVTEMRGEEGMARLDSDGGDAASMVQRVGADVYSPAEQAQPSSGQSHGVRNGVEGGQGSLSDADSSGVDISSGGNGAQFVPGPVGLGVPVGRDNDSSVDDVVSSSDVRVSSEQEHNSRSSDDDDDPVELVGHRKPQGHGDASCDKC